MPLDPVSLCVGLGSGMMLTLVGIFLIYRSR